METKIWSKYVSKLSGKGCSEVCLNLENGCSEVHNSAVHASFLIYVVLQIYYENFHSRNDGEQNKHRLKSRKFQKLRLKHCLSEKTLQRSLLSMPLLLVCFL